MLSSVGPPEGAVELVGTAEFVGSCETPPPVADVSSAAWRAGDCTASTVPTATSTPTTRSAMTDTEGMRRLRRRPCLPRAGRGAAGTGCHGGGGKIGGKAVDGGNA